MLTRRGGSGSCPCVLLTAFVALALASGVEGSRRREHPWPGTTYADARPGRTVVYRGLNEDCEVMGGKAGDVGGIQPEPDELLSADNMTLLIDHCNDIHSRLYSIDPDWYEDGRQPPAAGRPSGLTSTTAASGPPGRHPATADAFNGWNRQDDRPSRRMTESLYKLNVLNSVFIFPGTKWCGQGSVAENFNDIGYHKEVDRCCRDHDLCLESSGEFLAPGQCKNGLCNHSPFTRSPCGCDRQFVQCLKLARTRLANVLGRTFFNVGGITCYKLDYPIKRCLEYVDVSHSSLLPPWVLKVMQVNPEPRRPRCRLYELDDTKPKVWQFFETFYDETNHLIQEPRSSRTIEPPELPPPPLPLPSTTSGRPRRPPRPTLFQQLFVRLFFTLMDPV